MSISGPTARRRHKSPSLSPNPPTMDPETASHLKRPHLSQVQTGLAPRSQPPSISPSVASNSPSMALAPARDSPILFPEGAGLSTNSSVQASPELLESSRGRLTSDLMDSLVPPFQLPDSVVANLSDTTLSRKTSTNSLGQSVLASPVPSSVGEPPKAGMYRRDSSSVRRKITGSFMRRASSTHPKSRDGSVGPSVFRSALRRNSSTETPPDGVLTFTDSDSDPEERDEMKSLFSSADGASQDFSPLSATPSVTGFTQSVPIHLLKGTPIGKVSKKRKNLIKPITLSLDPDAAKIWWDKGRSSKMIYLDDIKEIRTAPDIRQTRLDCALPEHKESLFFTIIYEEPDKPGTRLLHLVANDEGTFQCWTQTLQALSKHRQDFALSLMSFNDKAIREYWQREMTKQYGDRPRLGDEETIDLSGVERVCRNLHIHVSSQELRDKFDLATQTSQGARSDSDDARSIQKGCGRLDFGGFLEFVRLMKTRKDIRPIYRQLASDIKKGLTLQEFLYFIREVQNEETDSCSEDSWKEIFTKFARKGRLAKETETSIHTNGNGTGTGNDDDVLRMSESALGNFLASTWNYPLPSEPRQYELNRPMNEYYISSSHNTYLLGRQVAGISSVEGYISALMKGCRCVEVDCWDGADNVPMVVHGRTMTTQISFEEVIKTIHKYAFVKSRFPLWVSLEVRCNWATQQNMAKIILDNFGSKLVTVPLDPETDRLPSPSQLVGRILVKVKKSHRPDDQAKGGAGAGGSGDRFKRMRSNSHPSPYQRALAMDNMPVPSSPLLSPTPVTRSSRQINTITEGEVHEGQSSSPSECDSESDKDSTKKTSNKINPVLGDLGVYSVGIHFNGFDNPDAKTFNHIFSFKEKTFAEKNQPGDAKRALYRHNMRYMMRVYPNATRISSSNFDPLIYWKRGVQMAALNWQTFDLGMQVNQAMFDSGTDQSGYVLKPLEGRQFQVLPSLPADEAGKRPRKNISVKIDVISAQQLMRPYTLDEKRTLNPYVEVEVFLADDKRNKLDAAANAAVGQATPMKYRTKIVRENGFNPEFDGTHTFNVTTKYPDLIFVRWSVKLADRTYNDRAPPIATFTAKLNRLKQGYRTLPLLDHNGDRYLFSTLFCRIKTDFTDVLVPYPGDGPDSSNKLKINRGVFRSNASTKSSIDSGVS